MSQEGLLTTSVMRGDCASVEGLLKEGKDPDAPGDEGRRPLHWAVQEGYIDIVKCLIAYRADVNIADIHGITPLAIAVGEGNGLLVRELIRHGASPNQRVKGYANGTA